MLQKSEISAAKNNTALAAIIPKYNTPLRGYWYYFSSSSAVLVESIRNLRLQALQTKLMSSDPVVQQRAEGYMAGLDDVRAILMPDEIRWEDIL